MMAGGLAGSVVSRLCVHMEMLADEVQCILVLKYVMKGYAERFKYYGYANVSQNVLLMLSAFVLWIAQSTSSEYEYNLTL
jgi:hypothetical protein